MIGMACTKGCGPLKMLRTHIGKSSRLFISILVIQEHIESIGKPILLKGDEVLLNDLLAQMLSDIAPKLSTAFSTKYVKTLNSNSAPLIFPTQRHRVHII